MNRVIEIFSADNKQYRMAEDIMGKFYTCLNLRLEDRLYELTKIIDQSSPTKELQALFPQLINNIFASSFSNGWNLKAVTSDNTRGNRLEYDSLMNFLEPQGPMFRLCYKLMCDHQLKYDLPLNMLPLDLQMSLERGRCPQFYTDMLVVDSQTMNFVALALNPFDYYIFNFALHLVNNSQQQTTWENWNSVYFSLACDYLIHFLPVDPSMPVLPHIPNYTGKAAMPAPLQTANRPLHTPSLLLIPDLCGMSSQHTSPQTQSRNEVWRSETVLQVFVDIWMSVEHFNSRDVDLFQRVYQSICSTPERVRTVRVLVKHIHSYSAKHLADPAARSSALRKYARQIMCARAYHYVKHLVQTWPLDASFRLVLELWLSLIQPWRYTENVIQRERSAHNINQEDGASTLEPSYAQFIAENFPSYTCILQLVLPRFMRMDLTVYKNAVMLFRVGKVFSQQHLVPILWNLERAMTDGSSSFVSRHDSYSNFSQDQGYTYNGVSLHKYVAIAKQAITELNMCTTFEYDPVWCDSKIQFPIEFVRRIHSAKIAAESIAEDYANKLQQQHIGIWKSIKNWLMINDTTEEEIQLEECQKVPTYLNTCIHFFSNIFGLNESSLLPPDPIAADVVMENSSFANSTNFPQTITNKLRSKPTSIQYMGDPDLMPIMSHESTILVRMLYQISSKINETYGQELSNLYYKNNFWGFVAREILEKPCTIRTYVKDATTHQNIVTEELPPRLSLRKLGSHIFIFWMCVGYVIFRLLSYSGFMFAFIVFSVWLSIVFIKAAWKMLISTRT